MRGHRYQLLPVSALLGAVLAAGALFAAGRPAPALPDAPPDVAVGTELYDVQFSLRTQELFPSLTPARPLEVKAVRGSWLLLEVPGVPRGPLWVNFDQVISYKTSR